MRGHFRNFPFVFSLEIWRQGIPSAQAEARATGGVPMAQGTETALFLQKPKRLGIVVE
jgi:hypothetical protein